MLHPNVLDARPTLAEPQPNLFKPRGTSQDLLIPAVGVRSARGSGSSAPVAGTARAGDLASRLFSATADAKIWTSQVAMHLDVATRDRIFRQVDALHELDEWDDLDRTLNLEAYKSFIRAIVYHKVNSRPSLALMPDGNILALWRDGEEKLSIEFRPGNEARWAVQHRAYEGLERASGLCPLERLRILLRPYEADRWFNGS